MILPLSANASLTCLIPRARRSNSSRWILRRWMLLTPGSIASALNVVVWIYLFSLLLENKSIRISAWFLVVLLVISAALLLDVRRPNLHIADSVKLATLSARDLVAQVADDVL